MTSANKHSAKILKIGQISYPPLLREIPNPPKDLYLKGCDMDWLRPAVAMVGTRKATKYGLEAARSISRELAQQGIIIVSGLALGIDSEAHRGALEGGGSTIAVLGSGINQIYPMTNRPLAEKIMTNGGALVSEFEPDFPPERWTFPQRNRIIAGLSQMTVVVEAPEKSGALITAFLALEFDREVGAVPGEISSINSRGANKLMRLGARVITSADDILESIGLGTKTNLLDKGDEKEQIILQCLASPKSREELIAESDLPVEILNSKLSILELKGVIENRSGMFKKIGN